MVYGTWCWTCRTPAPFFGFGYGKTPACAYYDWQYT